MYTNHLQYYLKRINKNPKRGEECNAWKGDRAGYAARHQRVYILYGKAYKCERCRTKTAKRYEWANLSGEYKLERTDWKQLCVSCHRRLDAKARPIGEKHGRAKLNEFLVRRIREIGEALPSLSQPKIAKMFGISVATVRSILKRKTWKHIL